MTQDALAGDRLIAIVQLRPDEEWDGDGEPPLVEMACLGKILKHERLPDGRFNFLLRGRKRARLVRELDVPTLYRQATVDLVDDLEPIADTSSESAELTDLYREVAGLVDGLSPEVDAMLASRPPLGTLTDLMTQSIGLPPALKQAFLDDRLVARRAERLASILRQVVEQLREQAGPTLGGIPPFSEN